MISWYLRNYNFLRICLHGWHLVIKSYTRRLETYRTVSVCMIIGNVKSPKVCFVRLSKLGLYRYEQGLRRSRHFGYEINPVCEQLSYFFLVCPWNKFGYQFPFSMNSLGFRSIPKLPWKSSYKSLIPLTIQQHRWSRQRDLGLDHISMWWYFGFCFSF